MKRPARAIITVVISAIVGIAWWRHGLSGLTLPEKTTSVNAQVPSERRPSEPSGGQPQQDSRRIDGKSAKPTPDWTSALREYAKDPNFQATARRNAGLKIEQHYGRLFPQMRSLTPDQLDALKEALATDDLAMMQLYLPRSASESLEEQKARTAEVESLKQRQLDRLETMLGEDNFARLVEYDRSFAYRPMIESITNGMRSNGVAVDETTQETMLRVYADVFARVSAAANKESQALDLSTLPPEQKQVLRSRQMERFDSQLADAMGKTLDPSAFRAFMDAELKMQESGG